MSINIRCGVTTYSHLLCMRSTVHNILGLFDRFVGYETAYKLKSALYFNYVLISYLDELSPTNIKNSR